MKLTNTLHSNGYNLNIVNTTSYIQTVTFSLRSKYRNLMNTSVSLSNTNIASEKKYLLHISILLLERVITG